MNDNILYLVQLRASAIEQAGKDGYTWMAPSHVLNLLDTIEKQHARITKLKLLLEECAENFEMWHEAKYIRAKIDAALKDAPDADPHGETCSECQGSGYGGHPDSGALCVKCNGTGEVA